MIELPKRSEVNRSIPKKVFYEKVNISSQIKQEFVDKVEKIYWKYKISEESVNISKTIEVEEIEIFEIVLKEKNNAKNIIKIITKEIPYPILFKIIYKEEYIYAIKYEEEVFYSQWNVDINFEIKGFDLQTVYENILRQITYINDKSNDIQTEVNKLKQIEELQKEIDKLKSKIKKEQQFNIKVEYNRQLNELKNKLEELSKNG